MAQGGRVAGKTALVTGGAGGIGRAIALRLAEEGARVVIADLDRARGTVLAGEIGAAAAFLPLDVTEPESWQQALSQVVERFGGLHVLVNNAGVALVKDVEATSFEEWRQVLAVNLDGVFLGCKYALPVIRASLAASGAPGGSIINMSSVSGLVGGHNLAAYNASKGGVRLLTKSVALSCARRRDAIRCNSVHPAFVDTAMVDAIVAGARDPQRIRERLAEQIPIGRMATAAEVAAAVLYLACEDSRFVTGSELVIDGGLTAQ